jgi:predicted nuclease with RNAse H fold
VPTGTRPRPREPRALGVDVGKGRYDAVLLVDGQVADDPVAFADPDELGPLVSRWRPHAIAVDSPPAWAPGASARACEAELLRRGILLYRTPAADGAGSAFYDWMRSGIALFDAAAACGFPVAHDLADVRYRTLEVFPHAVAVALRGHLPEAGVSRDPRRKRAWREAVLRDEGVDVGRLRTRDAVDAALAALCADRALRGQASGVGVAGEGVIVLPVPAPLARYPRPAPTIPA